MHDPGLANRKRQPTILSPGYHRSSERFRGDVQGSFMGREAT